MKDFKNEFSWSFSRDNLFRECKRKYYYNYYGSWGGWSKEKADEVTRTLYVLKNLVNRKIWKGDAVHKEIARLLKSYVTTKDFVDFQTSVKRVTNVMRSEFRYSREKEYWNSDTSLRKVNALFEHEYDVEITDEEWKKNHREVIECIKCFYKSDIPSELKQIEIKDILSIDDTVPTPFDFNHETIYVNLDLAYRLGDEIHIVDWKTGTSESNPLQFLVYTIHANEYYNEPLDKISVIEYNLLDNIKTTHKYNESDVQSAKDYIATSIREMKSYLKDQKENIGVITNFPRTEDTWKCDLCNFKKICFDLP